MEQKYKVSIIVPIYNVEKYLKRALNSIVSQTLKEIEIILVNDGSTDRSGEIIEEYCSLYSNCILINKVNGGLSDARNSGISVAKGEYIGFVDPDDYIESDMFEKLYNSIISSKTQLSICNYYEEFSNDNILKKNINVCKGKVDVKKLSESFIKGEHGAYVWNKLYSNKIIKDNKILFPIGISVTEDVVFYSKYLQYVKSIVIVDDYLYHYIRNNSSICSKYYKNQYNYYKVGYLAKHELILNITQGKLIEYNNINYLMTILRMFDQMYSFSNKDSLINRYDNMISICQKNDLLSLINKYENYINIKELKKKILWIKKKKYIKLFVYEEWKMRILARFKYYFN